MNEKNTDQEMSSGEDDDDSASQSDHRAEMHVEYEFSQRNTAKSPKDVDSVWSWVVLFSTFANMIFEGISLGIVGIIHVYLLEVFNEDETTTAWAGSLFIGIQCLLGPVSSWMADRWGCRTCVILGGLLSSVSLAISSLSSSLWMSIFTYGILNSCGTGLFLTPSYVICGFYFKRHTSFASAISVLGVNFGIMLGPVILSKLEQSYGWRGAVLILSGLVLHVCAFGALQRPSTLEKQKLKNHKAKCWTVCQTKNKSSSTPVPKSNLLRSRAFILLVLAFSMSNFAMSILYLHVPKYVIVLNGSMANIQAIFLAMGIAGVLAKLLVGLGSGLDKLCLLIGAYTIAGIALLVLPTVSHSQLGRVTCLFIATFYYNVEPPLYVPVSLEIVGLKNLTKAIGYELCGIGLCFIVGPLFAAMLLEHTGDYAYSIYLAGITYLLASIACLLVGLSRRNNLSRDCNTWDKKCEMTYSLDKMPPDVL